MKRPYEHKNMILRALNPLQQRARSSIVHTIEEFHHCHETPGFIPKGGMHKAT